MRKALYYAFVLIVAYLILIHFTGFSKDIAAISGGGVPIIKAFQGR
jgi:hypothetical protein